MSSQNTKASIPLTRRSFTAGVGTVLGALSLSGVASSTEGAFPDTAQSQANTDRPLSCPALGDINENGRFETVMHLDGNPVGQLCEGEDGTNEKSDRERVVRVTSNGEETVDYASSIVDLTERDLTLGDVTGSDARLQYDYFEGPNNRNAAPDEVFVITDYDPESDGNADSADGEVVTVAHLTGNDGRDPDPADVDCSEDNKQWRTRDVANEIASAEGWRDRTVTREMIETGEMLLPEAIALRDSDPENESLVARYGEDVQLLAVGFGKGWTTRGTVVDVYYDELVVNDETYDFRAAIPMDADVQQRGNGAAQVSLELQQDELGVDPSAVVADSVGLWPFERVTSLPPVYDGASARGVRGNESGIQAVIPANELDRFGSGKQDVIVSGEIDVEGGGEAVAFVATDTVDFGN